MPDITIIVNPAGLEWEVRLEGQTKVLCRSPSPFLAAARALAAYAVADPGCRLYMKHRGDDQWALRGRLRAVVAMAVKQRDKSGRLAGDQVRVRKTSKGSA